ncbi:S9 family peptidase [Actinomadura sp. NEAU-AAG7]|uniref:alpha/beta hydrolase family protein n=1 Tax=Actinomadura sp. NEAU-AAG7 TaxID=2839640 RepID=UPI001BE43E16|nr:alpha/beta fold hydrolase [Actinomadura sp. NEAU-AAG7]MBT2208592.1 alpha/beta hydrolase [Actinomadura sp. NEAU-AAG7]
MTTHAPESPAPATPEPARPARRRRVRRLVAALTGLVLLVCAALGGVGWYFAGVATQVDHSAEYPFRITDAGNGTVTLPRDPDTERPGTWALAWPDGRALLGPVVGGDRATVVRRVASVLKGTPAKGARATIDHWLYEGDPKTALGLAFEDVAYPTRVGRMPAWLLPGTSPKGTWVIAVHGRNAGMAETFRAMKPVHATGMTMLSIAYRNDVDAPRSADHRNHMGATEWRDVASAVAYARANGATGVVLYGWSMGGAMAMKTLRADPSFVRGVVLDSPVMDWSATLDKQGDARHLPRLVTDVAKRTMRYRFGIDLDDLDQTRFAPRLRTPVLMFTTAGDRTVANRPAFAFAKAAPPGMVTHVTAQGDHTEAWNTDPAAYERALASFLARVGR